MEIPNDDLTPDDIESGADLVEANFSGADLSGADLSGARLYDADFSEANLRGANLSGANLLKVNLSGVVLSRGTQVNLGLAEIDRMNFRIGESGDFYSVQEWDAIARMYHELKTAYSANGLVGRAWKYRVRERRARAREARDADDLRGTVAWFGSYLSRIITGYGVQLRWPLILMLVLFVIPTATYVQAGIENSLVYSIVTFTTAPPAPLPNEPHIAIPAMIQTFGGTLLIVVLGYVLGNREQV